MLNAYLARAIVNRCRVWGRTTFSGQARGKPSDPTHADRQCFPIELRQRAERWCINTEGDFVRLNWKKTAPFIIY